MFGCIRVVLTLTRSQEPFHLLTMENGPDCLVVVEFVLGCLVAAIAIGVRLRHPALLSAITVVGASFAFLGLGGLVQG